MKKQDKPEYTSVTMNLPNILLEEIDKGRRTSYRNISRTAFVSDILAEKLLEAKL